MLELLQSIKNINDTRSSQKPKYEAHVFFDGAIHIDAIGNMSSNSFGLQLLALVEKTFSKCTRFFLCYPFRGHIKMLHGQLLKQANIHTHTHTHIYIYIYIYIYIHIHVYICMYVCMYVCIFQTLCDMYIPNIYKGVSEHIVIYVYYRMIGICLMSNDKMFPNHISPRD